MTNPTRFPWRLFSRIVGIQAVSLLLALGASGIAARYFFERQFLAQAESQLRISLASLSRDLPVSRATAWCASHSADPTQRLTVIAEDGAVICDSHHDPGTMENHLARPEVAEALARGYGHSRRFSSTLSENMVYGALHLPEKRVLLRGAIPISILVSALSVFDASLAVFLLLVACVLLAFAVWSGRRLAFPIARLLHKARAVTEPGGPLPPASAAHEPYGELSELETSLDHLRRDLESKAESLNREREEHATLMGALSDAILAVDLEGSPLFFNGRFAMLFGQGSGLREGKARLWELIRDPEVLEAFRVALGQGRAGSVSAVAFGQDSRERYFSLSVSPLTRGNSEVYGAVGIFHDVSELKRAEQMRIDFVANVSHELRTPLTAIKGYVDTISADLRAGHAVAPEHLLVIERNSHRLLSLVNDLLDLSSLEAGAEDLRKSEVDTLAITEKVRRQLERATAAKGQTVRIDAQAPVVPADPGRLEQVLVNLMDNASKYSPPGGTIEVSWTAEAGRGVELRVKDNGPGIAPEHHARLFERFYRVDKARSREIGGTGLGLAIVKHILQRHGGTVRVESRPGGGSTFLCFFPFP